MSVDQTSKLPQQHLSVVLPKREKIFFFFRKTRQIFAAYHLGYMQPINQHDYYNVTYDQLQFSGFHGILSTGGQMTTEALEDRYSDHRNRYMIIPMHIHYLQHNQYCIIIRKQRVDYFKLVTLQRSFYHKKTGSKSLTYRLTASYLFLTLYSILEKASQFLISKLGSTTQKSTLQLLKSYFHYQLEGLNQCHFIYVGLFIIPCQFIPALLQL